MSQTRDSADELLDEVVARLKSMPVPDYPGPPDLDLSLKLSGDSRLPTSGKRTRTGALVVVCSVLALSFAALIMQPQTRTATPGGLTNVVKGPVHMQSFELDGPLLSIERELDALSQRLDEINEEIACQELRSDAATLLARYSTPEPKTW